jgi:DNA mismatch repair protein MutS2
VRAFAQAKTAADDERERAAEERMRAHHQLLEDRERLRQRAAQRIAEAMAELQQARARGEFPGKKRLAAVRHTALDLDEPPPLAKPHGSLEVGHTVTLDGTRSTGVVSRILGDRAEVIVADKRIWVDRSACVPAVATVGHAPSTGPSGPGLDATALELKLLGLTQEEARDEIERFLDRAMLGGATIVRIVHGHGSGALRRLVREMVASHPAVARFGHPSQQRGGTGVTEVELE